MSRPHFSRRTARALGCLASVGVLLGAGVSSASADNQMYWSAYNANTIATSSTNGAGGRDLVGDAGAPNGTVVDPAAGTIYWASYGTNEIRSADLDGNNVAVLDVTGATVSSPYGLTLDPTTSTLYWANDAGDTIQYAKTDGSGGGELYNPDTTPELQDPVSAAVDPPTNKIYWANYGSGTIGYANLDGTGGAGTITFSGACSALSTSFGVQVDSAANAIYQFGYDGSTGIVQRAALDGSGCVDLVNDLSGNTTGGALDPDTNRLIYPDYNAEVMRYIDLTDSSTGTIDPVGASMAAPAYLALMATPVATAEPALTRADNQLTCGKPVWSVGIPGMRQFRSPSGDNEYYWTRDGEFIEGAMDATLTVTQDGTYRCVATASNRAGAGEAASEPITITIPTPTPTPTPAPSAVPSTEPITTLARPIVQTTHTGRTRVVVNLRYNVSGRYSFYYQRPGVQRQTAQPGSRVAMLRGSRVGKRVLTKTFSAPVVVNGVAGQGVTLKSVLPGTPPKGTELRVVLRKADGSLEGTSYPLSS